MLKKESFLFVLAYFCLFYACSTDNRPTPSTATTFSEDNVINAVVEVSAGDNIKQEFDVDSNRIKPEKDENGKIKQIDYLAYPANYGYIAQTRIEKESGGEGEDLDVLILSKRLESGTVIGIKPIATLVLRDNGIVDTKVIAIPIDTTLQIIKAYDYQTFITRYNSIQQIIQQWFLNYKGIGQVEFLAWRDDRFALMEIRKWSKSNR